MASRAGAADSESLAPDAAAVAGAEAEDETVGTEAKSRSRARASRWTLLYERGIQKEEIIKHRGSERRAMIERVEILKIPYHVFVT